MDLSDNLQHPDPHRAVDLAGPRGSVVARVREQIESRQFRPGDLLPSERVLAKSLQVSRDTVRAALRELTDQGWLAAGKGSRRRVSDSATGGAGSLASCVAMIAAKGQDPLDASKPWIEDRYVMALAGAWIEKHGYHVLSVSLPALKRTRNHRLAHEQLQALMVSGAMADVPEVAELIVTLIAAQVPVVFYGSSTRFPACPAIHSDHRQGAAALTRWLLAQGRRRIRCAWMRDAWNDPWLAERFAGYEMAMREAGLEPAPLLRVPQMPDAHRSRDGFEEQVKLATGYLAEHVHGPEPVDALLALNDPQAIYLAAACRKLGRRPNQDIWLAGYDNTWRYAVEWQFESEGPRVTVDKGNPELARRLADAVLARVGGGHGDAVAAAVPATVIEISAAGRAGQLPGG